jgi:YVTN family beta-propeller protein
MYLPNRLSKYIGRKYQRKELSFHFILAQPYAFITNQLDNNVAVIDLTTNQVIKTIPVQGKPVGVAVTFCD